MKSADWTVEVREILPDVDVQIGDETYTGRVSGRKNPFATVTLLDGRSHEFSWDAVARAYFQGELLQG